MLIEREVIRANITAKGFRENPEKKNPDHDYYFLYFNGKRTHIWIKLSHGSGYREYSDSLLGRQSEILGVAKKDFEKFALCIYSEAEFVEILRRNGKLDGR